MIEGKIPTPRDNAQVIFERSGKDGFVEDFIEVGADDLNFMAMNEKDQKLWIKIVEAQPSLLDDLPYPG